MKKSLQRLLVEHYPNNIMEQSLALAAIVKAKKIGNASTLKYYSAKLGANVEELVTPFQMRWYDVMAQGMMNTKEHNEAKAQEQAND